VRKRCKVLIADDNERARNGLRALLAMRQEIEIVGEAADGREAVQKAKELQPNIVLMDAQMPQMDGLEATRQIKARWPQVRVVVVTMYASYRAEAQAAGADGFLQKGDPVEEFLSAILDDRSASDQNAMEPKRRESRT
jgi:DNA-binding NarL/FixJ family response regulator